MALFSKETTPPAARPDSRTSSAPQPGMTFVGTNITFEGTLTGSDPVLLEGTIRGKINLSGELRVGARARVEATVHAKNVVIEGKINGDISADERLELIASANVEGNLKAPKIIVAEGAKFRGNVDMGSKVPHDDAAPKAK
jgi:cytoskeletal protein CcmA (bactofilin family)